MKRVGAASCPDHVAKALLGTRDVQACYLARADLTRASRAGRSIRQICVTAPRSATDVKAAVFGAVAVVDTIFGEAAWTGALALYAVALSLDEWAEAAQGAILHRRRVARPPVAYTHSALIVVDTIFTGVAGNGAPTFNASALRTGKGMLSARGAILHRRRVTHAVGACAHGALIAIIACSAILDGRVLAAVVDPCAFSTLIAIIAIVFDFASRYPASSTSTTASGGTTAARSFLTPSQRHHAQRQHTHQSE